MSKKDKKKNKSNTSIGRKIVTLFLIFFMLILAVAVLYISTIVILASFENIDIDSYVLNQSSQIYCEDRETGNFVSVEKVYSSENRVWVPYLEMPQCLKDAAVAIEDERFFQHNGVDIKRTIGATITYLFNRESGYGGSTITQQVIKNMTGHDERSINRKIKEMWNSFRLERKMSKEQILELYLNTIYLSQGCNGVGSAANMYFNKDVSKLSVAEAASIVGITQYPTRYDPFLNPKENKKKQETILFKMKELGYLSDEDYNAALNEPLNFAKENFNHATNANSYFVDYLIQEVASELAEKKSYDYDAAFRLLHTGGFKIYSTLDPHIQKSIDAVYNDSTLFYEGTQSAMVVMDPYTGEIKGMSGGVGKKSGDFILNRATMSPRAPGSSIKPLAVYAPALEYNVISPYTEYSDTKITRGKWSPKNAYDGFKGNMSVANAIKISTNTIAVQVLEDLGIDRSFDFMVDKLGFTTLVDLRTSGDKQYTDKTLASLALGGLTDGVTVYEMAAAYSVFPNEGVYIKPHTFTKVVDKNGKVVLEADKKETIAMSKRTALQMTQLLMGVTSPGGTGSMAYVEGMPVAGKTGTTDNVHDKWFIGYTPYYVGAVWYGYDVSKTLPSHTVNTAVTTWSKVMNKIHKDLPTKKFPSVTMTNNVAPSSRAIISDKEEDDNETVADPNEESTKSDSFTESETDIQEEQIQESSSNAEDVNPNDENQSSISASENETSNPTDHSVSEPQISPTDNDSASGSDI